jgi:hypothetical protein
LHAHIKIFHYQQVARQGFFKVLRGKAHLQLREYESLSRSGPAQMMRPFVRATIVMLTTVVVCAQAQWLNYPAPGTPRTRDGRANHSARAPRTADHKPDLSGVWQFEPVPGEVERVLGISLEDAAVPGDDPREFSKYFFNILADFRPDDEPLKPAAAAFFRQHIREFLTANTETHCLPMGIPRAELSSAPFKIIQNPGLIVVLQEADGTHRQIYTDGRPFPPDMDPAWMGYSVAGWEGDTLIVQTAGFKDSAPLDLTGHPRSEATRITESLRRRDFGHMDLRITIDDPRNYTGPFTIKVTERLLADTDVLEKICAENEKDLRHLRLN